MATVWDAFAAAPATPLKALPLPRRELISRFLQLRGPAAVSELQAGVRGCTMSGEACYPGSTALLAGYRSIQRLIITDLDADCVAAQARYFQDFDILRAESRQMDCYRQAGEVLQQRPDLVFIDPPFLAQKEWEKVTWLYNDIRRLSAGSRVVLWYPLRDDLSVPAELSALPRIQVTVHYGAGRALRGCAMVFLNFETGLLEALRPLAQWLDGARPLGMAGAELVG